VGNCNRIDRSLAIRPRHVLHPIWVHSYPGSDSCHRNLDKGDPGQENPLMSFTQL